MPNVINVLAKWAAWGILLGLLFVTVVPAGARPIVVRGHYAEHILAFGALGVAFAIAYRQQTMALLIGLTCFCFAIEITQLFLPTRHARWQDLVVDVLAVCAGILLTRALQRTLKLRPG
ncbi:VanZ family protein [Bradyrhizobium sp. LHD-71]|uniref:VanZ family protein n=1 Tax=Bradyrhizobium sp. LHD-71 TaxID=3072141 RepID=UPI00281031D7|nr:VanZ family protein [Bradyrhizobium sp. LHD-71]MDQ8728061.1 VanZ family protein [Bradyrhizobium sp. LHD-71]